jgi:hypothetical protein
MTGTRPGPVGVQQHRGIPLPPNTRSVARPSRWGNPFRCDPTPTAREQAVSKYREWLGEHPELVEQARTILTGYNLACYCPLKGPCHRDVWLEYLTVTRYDLAAPGPQISPVPRPDSAGNPQAGDLSWPNNKGRGCSGE